MSNQIFFDFGNSRVKAWLCRHGEVLSRFNIPHQMAMEELIPALPADFKKAVDFIGVASVLDDDSNNAFARVAFMTWAVSPQWANSQKEFAGVYNGYADPRLLGVDRWVNVIAVSDRPCCCVVSCGTALAIDFVADRRHCGGFILPGYTMQLNALIHGTKRVRPDEGKTIELAPGVSTTEAVHRGIVIGLVGAVEKAISDFEKAEGRACSLVLTGGEAGKLGPHLSVSHDIIPELLLVGLQRYFGCAMST
ncbi:type III pantothenate kinase [Fluviicoccus keumensis]|uniref:Type III pantothenate kinase n=1 Tax=Fluviicoccus keumensis TaxID=1435465 RepID=A0A4Q7YFF6_9GAMM|nr:type III pantothenate kinase [Fluviicoccus keumensis]RZU35333.1 type III pantothenate kinase [Fluviicoccus keumensis]